jgi:hypothetical protein
MPFCKSYERKEKAEKGKRKEQKKKAAGNLSAQPLNRPTAHPEIFPNRYLSPLFGR